MKYEINTEIVFSTTHITEEESKRLTQASCTLVNDVTYGWRIYVSEEVFEGKTPYNLAHLPNVSALGKIAHAQGCKWLVLDCDGPVMDNLPKFEW